MFNIYWRESGAGFGGIPEFVLNHPLSLRAWKRHTKDKTLELWHLPRVDTHLHLIEIDWIQTLDLGVLIVEPKLDQNQSSKMAKNFDI